MHHLPKKPMQDEDEHIIGYMVRRQKPQKR